MPSPAELNASNDGTDPWSPASFALIETSLWQEHQETAIDVSWLDLSWQQPTRFWKALHAYWELRGQSKSLPGLRYDFYHDVVVRQKKLTNPAFIAFENGIWRTWSYVELAKAAEGLAASWEDVGVQPGELLTILQPLGFNWLLALLAGLRLGLTVSFLPPQGDSFVSHRLKKLKPQWLVTQPLYQHRLASDWQKNILPTTLSSLAPTRRSFEYPSAAIITQSFDPTSPTPDMPCPVDVDSLYLGALRDGVLSLGIKPGQSLSAPGWNSPESQPSLILAVLMMGATWIHIELAEVAKKPALLLEQGIDILGVSRSLRDVLQANPPVGEKPWRYWFRHPAESSDFYLWQNFIAKLQLQKCYAGNLLWNAPLGGAVLFSAKYQGQAHNKVLPTPGTHWQLGMITAPDLPCPGNSGRVALGREDKGKTVWTATPYILGTYLKTWNYLGTYPKARAGRTYLHLEVLNVLATISPYLALVEVEAGGGNSDPLLVLLAFGKSANATLLKSRIETELGNEFLPDRIEVLQLFPKRNEQGGADQVWCQFHYVTGELYRRQDSAIFHCLSELKAMILA